MHFPLYKKTPKITFTHILQSSLQTKEEKRLNPDLKMEENSNTINYAPFENLIILCIDRSGRVRASREKDQRYR
jgi:hypothetical protein